MAIAKLLRTEIVCGSSEDAALVEALEKSGLMQIEDAHIGLPDEIAQLEVRANIDLSACDAVLSKARWMLDAYTRFLPVKKGLMQGFFGSPPYVRVEDFHGIYAGFDLDGAESALQQSVREYDGILEAVAANEQLAAALQPWAALELPLEDLTGLRFARIFPVRVARRELAAIEAMIVENAATPDVSWTEVSGDEKQVWGIYAVVEARAAELEAWLRDAGAESVDLPSAGGTPSQIHARAAEELAELSRRQERIESTLEVEAAERRPIVHAIVDEHSNRRKGLLVRRGFFCTDNVAAVGGWILAKNRGKLEDFLSARLPSAQLFVRPPEKTENPPVHLENRGLLKPFQILLDMFGLPPYFGFDPTPVVAIAMTLFYAMCLGDVGYGSVQVLLALWLKRKFKPAEGTRLFLNLFMEMGAAAMIFGLMTWSFFGISPGYVVGGPKILGFLPLFVPTSDFLLVIGIALAIGVVYQLVSIVAGLYAAVRAGDLPAAIFDYGAWFALLVATLVWSAGVFLPALPPVVRTAGLIGIGVSCLVIVAFAGRDAKTFFGRIFTGIISLYGIVGYYGLVSFFSDVLSFCRLAILNLTSGFIAMVGNLLGGLIMSSSSIIAAILTFAVGAVIIVFFHVLNLVLSMMGSFIHSLRLNYLESFSRYYKTGGKPFLPLRKEGQFYRFEQ
jgi:V/A-type H+-transporting ATPase subunit I